MTLFSAVPPATGLYDPSFERDACGVAFVATMTGVASNDIVVKAITALRNLDHRGASGAEPDSGDGAGILIQVPDAFLRAVVDFELPAPGAYAVGIAFLPDDPATERHTMAAIERIADEEELVVLGWREVPVDRGLVGKTAAGTMPRFRQLFVGTKHRVADRMALERMAFCLR